jgi:hypothetical protein
MPFHIQITPDGKIKLTPEDKITAWSPEGCPYFRIVCDTVSGIGYTTFWESGSVGGSGSMDYTPTPGETHHRSWTVSGGLGPNGVLMQFFQDGELISSSTAHLSDGCSTPLSFLINTCGNCGSGSIGGCDSYNPANQTCWLSFSCSVNPDDSIPCTAGAGGNCDHHTGPNCDACQNVHIPGFPGTWTGECLASLQGYNQSTCYQCTVQRAKYKYVFDQPLQFAVQLSWNERLYIYGTDGGPASDTLFPMSEVIPQGATEGQEHFLYEPPSNQAGWRGIGASGTICVVLGP